MRNGDSASSTASDPAALPTGTLAELFLTAVEEHGSRVAYRYFPDEGSDLESVTFDDQKDPKRAIAGMEKMAQAGIHYVVGPNVDDGAAAVRPVAEANDIIYFPYAFPKALYTAPASNAERMSLAHSSVRSAMKASRP